MSNFQPSTRLAYRSDLGIDIPTRLTHERVVVSVSDDGMSETEFDDSDTEPDVERSDPSEKGPPLNGARLDYVDRVLKKIEVLFGPTGHAPAKAVLKGLSRFSED